MSRPSVTVYVCICCGARGEGHQLYRDIVARAHELVVDTVFVPVECLSACGQPATVAFAAKDRWSYVARGLVGAQAVDTLFRAIELYAEFSGGAIPWQMRPAFLKQGLVARLPPAASTEEINPFKRPHRSP